MDPNQQNQQQNQQKQKGNSGGNQNNKEGLTVQSNFNYTDGWNVKGALTSGAVNAGAYMAGTVFAAACGPLISKAIGSVWSFFSGNKNKQPDIQPQPQPQVNHREMMGRLCNENPELARQLVAQMQKSLNKGAVEQPNLPAVPENTPSEQ